MTDFCYPTPTDEDLPRLARLAYDLSERQCGSCRHYHVMWPFLRALGCNGGGPEYCWPLQQAALDNALKGRRAVRWLLVGSADAGQLALVADAMARNPDVAHTVTVVDRCRTPLDLCEAYAKSRGIRPQLVHGDFAGFAPDEAFDVALLHHVIGHIGPSERAAFLQRVRSWMSRAGRVLSWISYTDPANPGESMGRALRGWREAVLRAAFADGVLAAPESVEAFVARLDRMNETRAPGAGGVGILPDYLNVFAAAGFALEPVVNLPFDAAERTLHGGNPNPRCIIVATV